MHRSIKYKDDGADELMVKPGMTSLDMISDIKMFSHKPTGVYQTSGEYLGIGAPGSLLETYKVFERAGADFMITYGARDLVGQV